jgi:hypothetical protein
MIYIITLLVFVGLYKDVLAYPDNYASYHVPVCQYRILPFDFLQCMGHPKPPCHLLMLQDVTPAHKGLAPSGKMHTCCFAPLKAESKFVFFDFFQSLQQVCAPAHAGRTHAL